MVGRRRGRMWLWVGLGLAGLGLLSLVASPPGALGPESSEAQLAGRVAALSEHIDHLRHLDREKNKAFRELRERLLRLIAGLPGARDANVVLPTLSNLAVNVTGTLSTNASRLLDKLPAQTRAELFLNRSASELEFGVPNLYNFLPHLVNTVDGLAPAVRVAPRNRRHLHTVIGIPTVRRAKVSYLLSTLRSVFDNLDEEEARQVAVVVMLASSDGLDEWVAEEMTNLQAEFPRQVEDGLLEILVPPAHFYPPDLAAVPSTFDDSPERMKWRTKQNLDYAYLMMYAQNRGRYYLQLEDDVITKPGFLSLIKGFIEKQAEVSWLLLEFSSLGFIGKLFKSSDLPVLIQFLLMFHREKPVDWLLDHLFYVKFCSPEKAAKVCATTKTKYRIRYKPSLFQHVGVQSSLKGKVQKLKERDFGKSNLHRAHAENPRANVSTSLKVYQKYTLERAYRGETFFWGLLPQAGDWLRIDLSPPLPLHSLHFRSGNAEHPDDRFYNSSVQVRHLGQTDFATLTWFTAAGSAQHSFPSQAAPVASVRVVVEAESDHWLILSEIWLRTPAQASSSQAPGPS